MACEHHSPLQPGETILSVQELDFSYAGRPALHKVSMQAAAGRITGLLGPNGSGKTTLFRCCMNFLKPTSGQIELMGKALSSYSPRHLAQHVAYVPQESTLIFPFTVAEVVAMGRTPYKSAWPHSSYTARHANRHSDKQAVEHVMERVGISHLAHRVYSTLSGGQRQLALVARALAQSTGLIFMDEPTSSLDFNNQLIVWEALLPIAQAGVAIIICCHDPNHILWFCDKAVILHEGRVLADGEPKTVLTPPLLERLYGRAVAVWQNPSGRRFIYPEEMNRTK